MDKEKLQQNIENMEKELVEMKERLKDLEITSLFKPKEGEKYWFIITCDNQVAWRYFYGDDEYDITRVTMGNCYRTEEDAEKHKRAKITKRKLQELADRLNGDEKIDWRNQDQDKYSIYFNYSENKLHCAFWSYSREVGAVYCLDKNFLDEAIKELGKEAIIEYIESGE